MLAALIGGERNPKVLAQIARTRMRAKIPQLEEAFVGHFTDHHGFLLTKMLARIDALSLDIADLDTKIEAWLAPFADAVARLDEIPGVGATTAAVIIAAAPAILLLGFAILVVGFTPRWTSMLCYA